MIRWVLIKMFCLFVVCLTFICCTKDSHCSPYYITNYDASPSTRYITEIQNDSKGKLAQERLLEFDKKGYLTCERLIRRNDTTITQYIYHKDHKIKKIKDNGFKRNVQLDYSFWGKMKGLRIPQENGLIRETQFFYDSDGRLSMENDLTINPKQRYSYTNIQQTKYSYDDKGNRIEENVSYLKKKKIINQRTFAYNFDETGRWKERIIQEKGKKATVVTTRSYEDYPQIPFDRRFVWALAFIICLTFIFRVCSLHFKDYFFDDFWGVSYKEFKKAKNFNLYYRRYGVFYWTPYKKSMVLFFYLILTILFVSIVCWLISFCALWIFKQCSMYDHTIILAIIALVFACVIVNILFFKIQIVFSYIFSGGCVSQSDSRPIFFLSLLSAGCITYLAHKNGFFEYSWLSDALDYVKEQGCYIIQIIVNYTKTAFQILGFSGLWYHYILVWILVCILVLLIPCLIYTVLAVIIYLLVLFFRFVDFFVTRKLFGVHRSCPICGEKASSRTHYFYHYGSPNNRTYYPIPIMPSLYGILNHKFFSNNKQYVESISTTLLFTNTFSLGKGNMVRQCESPCSAILKPSSEKGCYFGTEFHICFVGNMEKSKVDEGFLKLKPRFGIELPPPVLIENNTEVEVKYIKQLICPVKYRLFPYHLFFYNITDKLDNEYLFGFMQNVKAFIYILNSGKYDSLLQKIPEKDTSHMRFYFVYLTNENNKIEEWKDENGFIRMLDKNNIENGTMRNKLNGAKHHGFKKIHLVTLSRGDFSLLFKLILSHSKIHLE